MAKKSPPKGAFSLTDAGRYSWEDNDCSVRSLAAALDITYEEAHANLKKAGRKDHDGCTAKVVTKALEVSLEGPKFIHTQDKRLRPTYAQWVKDHNEGTYIVFVTGHFFAVKDGMQLDMHPTLYRPRSRLYGYWRVA